MTSRTTLSVCRKHDDILNESIQHDDNNININNNNDSPSSSIFFNSNCSYSTQLDIFIAEPNQDLYEFRRRYPSQFLALVTNYLGFLVFTSDELDQIREILIKDAKQSQTTTLTSSTTSTTTVKTDLATNKSEVNDNNNSSNSNNTNESNSKTQYTPRKMLSRLREQKQNGKLLFV